MRERQIVNGRFEIKRRAGSGGMGTVFRAMDRQTGMPVAFKVINAGHSPELAERFQREAALLAELHHPGIVRFVASGATPDGQAYLVMDWLEGEGLADRLARGTLSVAETIELGRRVTSALSVAHARGIIHRDLKPGNLFLPGGNLARIVVLDFGIARAVESGQSLTSTGATLGSPGYLSPEQARGDKNLDTRADVFSLGCVLFRCLTGRAPFTGDSDQGDDADGAGAHTPRGLAARGHPPRARGSAPADAREVPRRAPAGRRRRLRGARRAGGVPAPTRCSVSSGRAREEPAADHGPRHGGAPLDGGAPEPARPPPVVPTGAEHSAGSIDPAQRTRGAFRRGTASPCRRAPLGAASIPPRTAHIPPCAARRPVHARVLVPARFALCARRHAPGDHRAGAPAFARASLADRAGRHRAARGRRGGVLPFVRRRLFGSPHPPVPSAKHKSR